MSFIPSFLLSFQRFTVTIAASPTDQAIAAVGSMNWTSVRLISNQWTENSNSPDNEFVTAELTSTTNVRFTPGAAGATQIAVIEVWEINPFFLLSNIQRGTFVINGTNTVTSQAITAVLGTKVNVNQCGWRTDLAFTSGTIRQAVPYTEYVDTTHIRGTRFNSGVSNITTIAYEVIDLR